MNFALNKKSAWKEDKSFRLHTFRETNMNYLLSRQVVSNVAFLVSRQVPLLKFEDICNKYQGTALAQWLRCCATNGKVAGSIPVGVIGIFL